MPDSDRYPPTLRIGILVFPDFEPLDVWGFIEAFSIARFIGTGYDSPVPNRFPFDIKFISNERCGDRGSSTPAPVRCYNGPRVAPDYYRDQALEVPFDLLMVPGGHGVGDLLYADAESVRALLDWMRAMDKRVPLMSSVCTGAAIYAAAGLYDGLPAATNHQAFGWVAGFGPKVHWDNVSRWVDAGRHVSSAGVSAGTDMAFYLVARLAGRAVAEQAALAAEYDWHRDPEEPIYYPEQAKVPTSSK